MLIMKIIYEVTLVSFWYVNALWENPLVNQEHNMPDPGEGYKGDFIDYFHDEHNSYAEINL